MMRRHRGLWVALGILAAIALVMRIINYVHGWITP